MPIISESPHLKSRVKTPYVMKQVIIGLLPAVIASVIFFKYWAVFLILNCCLTAVITESIICKIRRQPLVLNDYSALVTGLLLALILPPSISWYAATLGSVFAVIAGKHLFGGIGSNIFNPALIGRAFLMAAYPKMLTVYVKPFDIDAISSATPLALRKFSHVMTPLNDLFLGNVAGSLGETSAFCLIIGGAYIIIRKIADWRTPVSLLFTTAIIAFIFHRINPTNGSVLFHLLSGGLLIGALFMATDPVTTPITKRGRYIFGIGSAIVIMVIRYWGGLQEGVMYGILFMNAFTPLINRYTKPKRFGT